MLQRPKVGETEEDLLQQEEEFLRQSGKAPTQKRNTEDNNDEGKSSTVSGIVGEVVERSQGLPCTPDQGDEARGGGFPCTTPDQGDEARGGGFPCTTPDQGDEARGGGFPCTTPDQGDEAKGSGFPALFKINPKLTTDKKGKKSLFAVHMEKNKNVSDNITTEAGALNLSTEEAGEPIPGTSKDHGDTPDASGSAEIRTLSDDKKSVHEENLNKLSAMAEAEILKAQRQLHETLDPQLIYLLKSRSKPKENTDVSRKPQPQEAEKKDRKNLSQDEKIKETLRNYVGEKWLNMDFLEKEKLEWVGDIPSEDALQPGQSYSARFDFKGELQPYRTEIDVTNALYHHGDEPERPGYTIQELYQLSRSAVLQQRILALNALANIIYKSKLGYYDACFDGYLLHKLIKADLFLLLRFSIDKNALIPSAINCLRRLFYNDSDEYCLDRLLGTTEEDLQPLLFDRTQLDIEDERELTDRAIIHTDMIKGAMRTDLLIRITYILNHLPCERETVSNAILCFIRFARHSTETCERLALTPDLLYFVYSTINCDDPLYQSVKLFRVLTGQSKDVAVQIASRYPLSFLVTFLSAESMKGLTKRELYLLKVESIYLLRNFIRCGFMKDDFTTWTPCFVRILRYCAGRLDIYSESDFDFELFSALMALVRFCIRDKLPIDNNYMAMMSVCLEKWMNQLLQSQKFSYSSMKALGSSFAFFIDYVEVFGSDRNSLSFIRKVNGMISTLIGSPCFDLMATRLTDYSHLLIASPINRDPSSLPSVCSIYENGEDFLRIVNNKSTLPFFAPFVKYLQFSFEILNESKNNIELFVNHPAIRKYITEVIALEKNTGNWFEKYELTFLADVLQLLCTVKDKQTLKLGFRLLPMIRVDDEDFVLVATILTDSKNWDSNDDLFEFLPDIYLDRLFRPEVRNGYAMRHKNEAGGEDWPYQALTKFRGRDAVMEVKKILKFISLIMSREPQLLERISYTARYYHLCSVFLTDSNVFDGDIKEEMQNNFRCILENREKVDLSMKVNKKKSFYDLYTELITQYSAVSYGMHTFAEFVLFPLQNRFDASFRKLIWFEYLHVLKVITVPYPSPLFIDVEEFVEPYETDESLLVAYLNSISSNVISKQKNPFVYNLAVANINNYMRNASPDSTLYNFLSRRIRFTISERIKQDLTSW